MGTAGLHRFSVLVAGCTLFLVVAGALVTSNDAGLSVPDWPLSYGSLMPRMEGGVFWEHGHRMVATTVGLLTIVLAVWISRADSRGWMRTLGWSALGAVVAQGLLGGITVLLLQPKPVSIGHACLAELFFSTTVAIALFTSPAWRRGGVEVEDPGLRWLAVWAAASVFIQLALGAAARHRAWGALPHIGWAPIAAGMVLWLVIRILIRHAAHDQLRWPALTLVSIAFAQVFLGIAAYMSRIAALDAPQPMPVMVAFTAAHVAVGALTLAFSVVTAIQVHRYVRQPAAHTVPEGLPVRS
jgi:cytochrome c oxidase assembly protein subunit 15